MAVTNFQQYQQYQEQQVFTAPADKLLLMLFDGVLRFCREAKTALEKKDWEESHYYLLRAQDIVLELKNSLKRDYDFTEQLYALYDYLYRALVQVNLKKDSALLQEVMGLLAELKEMWTEVAQKARGMKKMAVGGGDFEG